MAKKKLNISVDVLTDFKGIGEARATELLEMFGSVKNVMRADIRPICEHFGEKTGINIFKSLHGQDAPLGDFEKKKRGRSSDYTTEIGKSISDMYAEGESTITEIMHAHGLSEQTFYNWRSDNLEFFELIKTAKQIRKGRNYEMALNGKKKLLEGYEIIEQTTHTEPFTDDEGRKQNRVKAVTINKRHQPPSNAMVIFELVNSSDGEYRHVQHIKHDEGTSIPPYDFSSFSDKELELFEKLSKKAMNGKKE